MTPAKLLRLVAILFAPALILTARPVRAQTTLHACYVVGSGTVYRIKTAGTPDVCRSGHVEFSWNQDSQGPQGPAGPVGPQGPVGPEGPAGSTAMSNLYFRGAGVNLAPGDVFQTSCPAGYHTISAGLDQPPSSVTLLRPVIANGSIFWSLKGSGNYAIYWLCAPATQISYLP